jgi:hypothetical protein
MNKKRSRPRKLKCFVACAFGKEDVDEMYDNAIVPVLNSLQILPLRVDRLDHNEDIDDKIFQLLNESDFCITDLTFARPSAYYEAGYATGSGKPVIYTVRSDHFYPKLDDPHGHLRVHFDLQMKNIIPWKSPTETFKNKLLIRIRKVTRQTLIRINLEARVRADEERFNTLSQYEQESIITDKARLILRKHRYRLPKGKNGITRFRNSFSGINQLTEPPKIVYFECRPSFKKTDFVFLQFSSIFLSNRLEHLEQNNLLPRGKNRTAHIFLVFFRPLPSQRLKEFLPRFTMFGDPKRLSYSRTDSNSNIDRQVIHIIDNIRSVEEFEKHFKRELMFMESV